VLILGQRKYGGPPPNWESAPPGNGCEVFCGKIPKDMYEDELIPLFEKCGTIWDLRLMMDPMTGTNRGYAFITFTSRDAAYNAVREVSRIRVDRFSVRFFFPFSIFILLHNFFGRDKRRISLPNAEKR
jgi:RNA recognition motif-containing protein